MAPGIGESTALVMLTSLVVFKLFSVMLAFTVAAVAAVTVYFISRRQFSVWSSRNVPGPSPVFMMGNMMPLMSKGAHVMDLEWYRQYGYIWGGYTYTYPEIVISDTSMLRNILVKDFNIFTNRQTFLPKDYAFRPNTGLLDLAVTSLNDEHWKKVRNIMTPSFTLGKIKLMFPHIKNGVETLSSVICEKMSTSEPIDVKALLDCFTLDVICAVSFGIQVDSQRKPREPVVRHAKSAFDISFLDPGVIFSLLFPTCADFLKEQFNFHAIFRDGQKFFRGSLGRLLEERRKQPKSPPDFMQLLMNAEVERSVDAASLTRTVSDTKLDKSIPIKGSLTDDEIMAQMLDFLLAGYETTAVTMTFALYHIAIQPVFQQRIIDEIRSVVQDEDDLTYEDLNQLVYLEAVILEALRMYPSSPRIERMASKPYRLTQEITIPADTAVVIPVYLIHHLEEHYPEPEKFDPGRFLPDQKAQRDPITFLPFGYGPRNCIGMRFAMIEMKYCFANILRKFEFAGCEKTEIPLKIDSTNTFLSPKNTVFLEAKLRKTNAELWYS